MRAILPGSMRIGVLVLLVSTAAWAQPLNVTFTSETLPIPGNQAGDTAILRDPWGTWRDTVFGTDAVNNGFYGFFVDGGTNLSAGFGAVGGVDARQRLQSLPESFAGGLVAVSATNAGQVLFFSTLADAGFPGVGRINTLGPRALALADFGDAGAFVFVNTQSTMMPRWQLTEDGGAVVATALGAIQLPAPPTALATASKTHRVYASVGIGGVLEIDPLAVPPTVVQVIDAGAVTELVGGLATYPQRDGGSLIITSVPARDLFRVYRAQPGSAAVHLADFTVTSIDGGRKIQGAESIDVWAGAFGVTDAGPAYDAGVIVVCDRFAVAGANYKLISWAELARSVVPPLPIDLPDLVDEPVVVMPVQPARVPFLLALPTTSPIIDLSFWPGQDTLVATLNKVALLSPRDLQPGVSDAGSNDGGLDAGVADAGIPDAGRDAGPTFLPLDVSVATIGRVEALRTLSPDGLLAVESTAPDGGVISVWTMTDGGLRSLLSIPSSGPRSVELADFADGGVWLFSASARVLRSFRLDAPDGGLRASPGADLTFSETISSVASWGSARRVFVSTTRGVFEVDPLTTTSRFVVDAGVVALGLYEQADGGALVLAVVADDRVRVVRAGGGVALHEFQVTTPDGGLVVRGIGWLDVSREPAGLFADGGARWPNGVLAIGAGGLDGGTIMLVDWAQLARTASPSLPIDPRIALGGGTAGGGTAQGGGSISSGGGRTAGGTAGGGEEPPPPGCCTGAPSTAVLPAMAFLLWLRRFARRRTK